MPVPEATTDETVGVGGIDLQCAGGIGHGAGEIGGIAGTIGDGRGIGVDRADGEVCGVLTGTDRIAEGQRIGAGAAGIGGRAAVIERQRRCAARDRHASLRLSVRVTALPALRSPLRL